MLPRLFRCCAQRGRVLAGALRHRLLSATKPADQADLAGGRTDLVRRRPALVAAHAFLRHQLFALRRRGTRPRCAPADRARLVGRASCCRTWRQALLLFHPKMVLRWHR